MTKCRASLFAKRYRNAIPFVVGLVGVCIGMPNSTNASDRPRPATNEEIAQLIQSLGDPSFAQRTEATRKLSAIGAKAIAQLHSAAKSDNSEIALRAEQILANFENLWFGGVEVSLSFSKPAVVWNEPTDLIVAFVNRSTLPARVPLDLTIEKSEADQPAAGLDSNARQVITMLDMADFLVVAKPDGTLVDLRVDDLGLDPTILAAVQDRISREPVSTIEPGARVVVRIPSFNRGRARFPLFDKGNYEVVFQYRPEWDDEKLYNDGVGFVSSEPISLTIASNAPAKISRSGVDSAIEIERDGVELVARFVNQSDQTVWVNTNFGNGAPFSEGSWVFTHEASVHEKKISPESGRSWRDFERKKLVELAAGDAVDLARILLADMRKSLAEKGADPAKDRWTVNFNYSNPCDRTWQQRQGAVLQDNQTAPEVLREPLPVRTVSTRLASNRLVIPATD